MARTKPQYTALGYSDAMAGVRRMALAAGNWQAAAYDTGYDNGLQKHQQHGARRYLDGYGRGEHAYANGSEQCAAFYRGYDGMKEAAERLAEQKEEASKIALNAEHKKDLGDLARNTRGLLVEMISPRTSRAAEVVQASLQDPENDVLGAKALDFLTMPLPTASHIDNLFEQLKLEGAETPRAVRLSRKIEKLRTKYQQRAAFID